jgi:hypothetical protein
MNEMLKVNRTLGFEIECGTETEYDEMTVRHSECGYDGSVECGYSSTEVRTDPIKDLNLLKEVYEDIHTYDMDVDNSCGLHIHVDKSDYTVKDTAKLLRFGKGIERLMYGLVDNSRCDWNDSCHKHSEPYYEYCRSIHYSWRHIFKKEWLDGETIPFDSFYHIDNMISWVNTKKNFRRSSSKMWNGKYQWLNCRTSYPTVEFRIFHATTDYKETQRFGMLAYHIVETVKNSTVRQLNFIINSIHQATSVEEMYDKLFDSIGLAHEFRMDIRNHQMARHLDEKYCQANRVAQGLEQAI